MEKPIKKVRAKKYEKKLALKATTDQVIKLAFDAPPKYEKKEVKK